jgi:HEAT repeat protein
MLLLLDNSLPASQALARMGLSALPAVRKALKNPDARVRHMAINVVGGFAAASGDPECVRLIHRFPKDPNEYVRADANDWLEELSGK